MGKIAPTVTQLYPLKLCPLQAGLKPAGQKLFWEAKPLLTEIEVKPSRQRFKCYKLAMILPGPTWTPMRDASRRVVRAQTT